MKHDSENTFDARVHSYLDGELDLRDEEEVKRLMKEDSILRRRIDTILDLQNWMKATRPSPPAALADRVMERLAADAPPVRPSSARRTDRGARSGWRGWFGARLHPAWVGAAGLALVAGLLFLTKQPAHHTEDGGSPDSQLRSFATGQGEDAGPVAGDASTPVPPAGDASTRVAAASPPAKERVDLVRHYFRLEAPGAQQVCLVGNFNRWKVCATPLERVREDLWQISVELERGRHEYMFVVDNEWVSDPRAAVHVDDGFGNRNAVLIL